MRHIIQRQVIRADIQKKLDVFDVQQQISRFYYDRVMKMLERIFDEMTDENILIEFDTLEIDIGIIREKELQPGRMDAAIETMLRTQLKKIIREHTEKKLLHRMPGALGIGKQWLFYMERGYLPWNTIVADNAWLAKVLEAFAVDYPSIMALRILIGENDFALTRMIAQHTVPFLASLVEVLTAQNQDRLGDFIEEIVLARQFALTGNTLILKEKSREIQKTLWPLVLKTAAAFTGMTPGQLGKKLIAEKISHEALHTIVSSGKIISHLVLTRSLFYEVYQNEGNRLFTMRDNTASFSPGEKDESSPIQDTAAGTLPAKPANKKNEPVKDYLKHPAEEGIFINNAGLVLVHPFLHSFFRITGLVEEGKFTDQHKRQRALYLLHYLATGRLEAAEHELVVAKVLTAYPLNEPVESNISISEGEQQEAEQLLEAMIAQWTILKNTSVAGLREGFLQRGGKLFSKNDTIHLIVEHGSIDMLLDYLPWNLSIVKLPWMERWLRVEWR